MFFEKKNPCSLVCSGYHVDSILATVRKEFQFTKSGNIKLFYEIF